MAHVSFCLRYNQDVDSFLYLNIRHLKRSINRSPDPNVSGSDTIALIFNLKRGIYQQHQDTYLNIKGLLLLR